MLDKHEFVALVVDGPFWSMRWVGMSVEGAGSEVVHAVLQCGREEGGSGARVDVAVEVFQHEVGELEDAEDVAWDGQLETLEDHVGECDNDLVNGVKF